MRRRESRRGTLHGNQLFDTLHTLNWGISAKQRDFHAFTGHLSRLVGQVCPKDLTLISLNISE